MKEILSQFLIAFPHGQYERLLFLLGYLRRLRASQVCQLLQLLAAALPNTAELSHF